MHDQATYRQLCTTQKGIPVFAQPWWLDVVCPTWNAAIVMKGEHLAGIWPYAIEQKMGISLLRTPLLTPYLGPVIFYPPDLKASKKDQYEHATISELMGQLPETKVWHLAMPPGIEQAGLFKNSGLNLGVQQTFIINLYDTEETILANMQDNLRRNLKKISEVTITEDWNALPRLYDFYQATLTRKGRGVHASLSMMEQLANACKENHAGALYVAREGHEIAAIVWHVWDSACSYYLLGAQNPDNKGYTAMSHLLWHCSKQAKNKGIPAFDLEGSMDEGVERFFRSFGGKRSLYLVLKKNTSMRWKIKQAVLG